MWTDGTLLFAAELDRIHRATRRRRLLLCNYPTDAVVEQVLQHLGLLEIMGRQPRVQISAEDVMSWRMHTDTDVEGALAEPLVSQFRKLFSSEKLAGERIRVSSARAIRLALFMAAGPQESA